MASEANPNPRRTRAVFVLASAHPSTLHRGTLSTGPWLKQDGTEMWFTDPSCRTGVRVSRWQHVAVEAATRWHGSLCARCFGEDPTEQERRRAAHAHLATATADEGLVHEEYLAAIRAAQAAAAEGVA